MKSRKFAFHVLEKPDDSKLAELYARLGDGAVLTPFQEPGFVASFYRSLPDNCIPLVVQVDERASGRPAMLLPLVRRRSCGIDHIEGVDGGFCDYVAPIMAGWFAPGPDDAAAIWRELKRIFRRADIITFRKMPAILGAERANPLTLGGTLLPMGISMRVLDLADEENPDHYRRSGLYKEGQRKLRRLRRLGKVEFRSAATREEASELFDHLIAQRPARFAALDRDEPLDEPAVRDFYREVVLRGVPAGRVMFCGLYLNDECIATDMGFLHDDTHHGIFTSMQTGELDRCSPGTVAFILMLDASAARGIRHYDMGVGESAYKLRLKCTSAPLYERHEALSFRGRLPWADLELRRMIRMGLARYPALRPAAEGLRQRLRNLIRWPFAPAAQISTGRS